MIDIEILSLEASNFNGYVSKITWNAFLIEDNREKDGSYYTAHSKEDTFLPEQVSDNFTPLDDITEEQVLSWINAYHDMNGLLIRLQEELNSYKQPPLTIEVVPWKKNETTS